MFRIKSFTIIIFLLLAASTNVCAQKHGGKSHPVTTKNVIPVKSENDLLAELQEERFEELLENTKKVIFFDSLVVNKDDFLSHLRLTEEGGKFTRPERLFAESAQVPLTGQAAFINSLSSAVLFSAADSTNRLALHVAYRNGNRWTVPQELEGLEDLNNHDYPYMLADGITLYFSAESEETLGGRDIYVTRYNKDTHQYVRPENIGLPFNSSSNDYLLAIDERIQIGMLVTDRRQPDDKVCIYWFVANESDGIGQTGESYYFDGDDEDVVKRVRSLASIESIAASQQNKEERRMAAEARVRLKELQSSTNLPSQKDNRFRFIINDKNVYTSFDDFTNPDARSLAKEWHEHFVMQQMMQEDLENKRANFATTRSEKTKKCILNLETQLSELSKKLYSLALEIRKKELK